MSEQAIDIQDLHQKIQQLQKAEKEGASESLPVEPVGVAIPLKYWIGEKSVRTHMIFKGDLSPKKTKKLIKKLLKKGYPVDTWMKRTPSKGGYGRY